MKHKYLNLNIGLIKENFAVIKRKDRKLWEEQGFKRIMRYPIFGYIPKFSEIIILGKPKNIEQFGIDQLKGSKIVDICRRMGTYGMGGPGFTGLKIAGEFGTRWLVYCIWASGEHILFDSRVLECHSKYEKRYKPWIRYGMNDASEEQLKAELLNMLIDDIILTD